MNNKLNNLSKLTPDYVEEATMFELNNFYRLTNGDMLELTLKLHSMKRL